MEKENLYFIAIIPAEEICDEITAFKLDFAERYQSRTALKVVPHITLKAPFKLKPSGHQALEQWFQNLPVPAGKFQVELQNFGAFPKKDHPVVYVQPVVNAPFISLQKKIIQSFRSSYPDIVMMNIEFDFKPHITIAYRDLSFAKFQEAWQIYQTKHYEAICSVSSFHLLQHNGKGWNIINTYDLK